MTIKKSKAQKIAELEKKFCDLVWFARSNPASDTDYWMKVPEDIRTGAFKSQMRVEEDYPDEVAQLRDWDVDKSNWQHGFNSGCLAAFRYVLELDAGFIDEDEEFEPCLDT